MYAPILMFFHRRGAGAAKGNISAFVGERPTNANTQALYAIFRYKLVFAKTTIKTLPEGLLFFTFWPLTKK
jgi:hypothetical protein